MHGQPLGGRGWAWVRVRLGLGFGVRVRVRIAALFFAAIIIVEGLMGRHGNGEHLRRHDELCAVGAEGRLPVGVRVRVLGRTELSGL